MDWIAAKRALIVTTDVSPDALHLLAGLAVYLLLAVRLDRSLRSVRALVLTAVLVVAGEFGDWLAYRLDDEILAFDRIWPDLVDGLTWPVALFLLGPWLQGRAAPGDAHG